jgi:hypothetical protein
MRLLRPEEFYRTPADAQAIYAKVAEENYQLNLAYAIREYCIAFESDGKMRIRGANEKREVDVTYTLT